MKKLNLTVNAPELKEAIAVKDGTGDYQEEARLLLFKLIYQFIHHPHEGFQYSGFVKARLLIPLWLALEPEDKHRKLLLEKLQEDLATLSQKVKSVETELDRQG